MEAATKKHFYNHGSPNVSILRLERMNPHFSCSLTLTSSG
jgi:hypothetical protein